MKLVGKIWPYRDVLEDDFQNNYKTSQRINGTTLKYEVVYLLLLLRKGIVFYGILSLVK